jgi:hypothetical protein
MKMGSNAHFTIAPFSVIYFSAFYEYPDYGTKFRVTGRKNEKRTVRSRIGNIFQAGCS